MALRSQSESEFVDGDECEMLVLEEPHNPLHSWSPILEGVPLLVLVRDLFIGNDLILQGTMERRQRDLRQSLTDDLFKDLE
jgi:hypothetical protein